MRIGASFPLAFAFMAACGSSSITNPNGGDPDSPIGGQLPDGSVADARETCTGAVECAVGQVCNPATNKCATTLSCTTNTECGKQAYCTPAGTCAVNMLYGPCDTTDNCIGGETCESGHCGCGGQVLTATAVPPNMLIALDRSQSMNNTVPGTGDSRWTVATRAIKNITTTYQAGIRFGLVLWPGESKSCGPAGEVDCRGTDDAIDLDFNTGMAIGDYLDSAGRCSLGTPIGNTLGVLDSYAGFADATRANYVVLVTDGDENCDAASSGPDAASALRDHVPEVKTFAIGFGGEVNTTILSAIARNGGTARTGDPVYYQADNEDALSMAFTNIAGSIVGCDYTLSSTPDDPNRLFVFLGQTMLVRDTSHANGWDYLPATQHLTFYGAICEQLKSGSGGALSVSFGCPVIP